MFNQVIILGRLARDVELRTTPSGKQVASACVVTSKRFKDSDGDIKEVSEFHNVVVWNGAENFYNYLKKGSKVQIIGELRTRQWEREGQKHYTTEIIANQFIFLDNKQEEKPIEGVELTDKQIDDFDTSNKEDEVIVENIPF